MTVRAQARGMGVCLVCVGKMLGAFQMLQGQARLPEDVLVRHCVGVIRIPQLELNVVGCTPNVLSEALGPHRYKWGQNSGGFGTSTALHSHTIWVTSNHCMSDSALLSVSEREGIPPIPYVILAFASPPLRRRSTPHEAQINIDPPLTVSDR